MKTESKGWKIMASSVRYMLEDEEFVDLEREAMDYEFNSYFDHKLGMFSPAEYPGHVDGDYPEDNEQKTVNFVSSSAMVDEPFLFVGPPCPYEYGKCEVPF